MIVIGLTGSIGMGKSTAAAMLQRLGVPVHDADAAVHDLLQPGSAAMPALRAAFPFFRYPQLYGRKTKKGRPINREKLGALVFRHAQHKKALEKILHPLVRRSQNDFIKKNKAMGIKIIALDIPLLFETGGERRVDYTLVVTAPAAIQRKRVLARRGMTAEKFEAILAQQMPDAEKRARADFVVKTGLGRADTMRQLKAVLQKIEKRKRRKA